MLATATDEIEGEFVANMVNNPKDKAND